MRVVEGRGVGGHVGGGSSPERSAFVRVFENVSLSSLFSLLFSLLSLSGLVLFCLVLWCVCWCARAFPCVCVGVQHTPRSFPQESWSTTALSGTANDRRNREHVVLDLFSN